jgi:hypothetical protein
MLGAITATLWVRDLAPLASTDQAVSQAAAATAAKHSSGKYTMQQQRLLEPLRQQWWRLCQRQLQRKRQLPACV